MRQTIVNTHRATRRYQIICFMVCFIVANLWVFGQTWTMQHDHKLLPQQEVTIDSLIGNGFTLYMQCGSKLTITKHVERVHFATMRFNYERCNPLNTVQIVKGASLSKVIISKCIKPVGISPKNKSKNEFKR